MWEMPESEYEPINGSDEFKAGAGKMQEEMHEENQEKTNQEIDAQDNAQYNTQDNQLNPDTSGSVSPNQPDQPNQSNESKETQAQSQTQTQAQPPTQAQTQPDSQPSPQPGQQSQPKQTEALLLAPRPETRQREINHAKMFSVKYTILRLLAEKLDATPDGIYARTIADSLKQYGVTSERVLIELNKLINSRKKLVRRIKSPITRRYLYKITENGLNELRRLESFSDLGPNLGFGISSNPNHINPYPNLGPNNQTNPINPFGSNYNHNHNFNPNPNLPFGSMDSASQAMNQRQPQPLIDAIPLDPYRWLLENLVEAKTFEELRSIRNDSEKTLSVYLSQLYRLGVIDKQKTMEEKKIMQRDRNGRIITRVTKVQKTYYFLRPGPLRDKLTKEMILPKPPQAFKVTVPLDDLKEPAFTPELEKQYLEWREQIKGKDEFHARIIREANRRGVLPKVLYKVVFMKLKQQGKI